MRYTDIYLVSDGQGSEMYVWVPAKYHDRKRTFCKLVTGFGDKLSLEMILKPTAQQTREAKANTKRELIWD